MICCLTAAGLCCCAAKLRRRKRTALALLGIAITLAALHVWPDVSRQLLPDAPSRNPIICYGHRA